MVALDTKVALVRRTHPTLAIKGVQDKSWTPKFRLGIQLYE